MLLFFNMLRAIAILCSFSYFAQAQISCSNGISVYEKWPATSIRLESRADRTLEMPPNEAPTSGCQRICEGSSSCVAFTVEYSTRICKTFNEPISKSRLIFKSDTAFFQKICIPDLTRDMLVAKCGSRSWVRERALGVDFRGQALRTEQNVATREHCYRLCLFETAFECATSIYDEASRTCHLSPEDRRSRISAVTDQSKTMDYMENQCISLKKNCEYSRQSNAKVVSVDDIISASGEDQCQQQCTMNRLIVCRSYSYDLHSNTCELSSDDSVSLPGVELLKESGRRYAERRCQSNQAFPNFPQHLQQSSNQFLPPFNHQFGAPNPYFPTTNTISRFDQLDNQDPRLFLGNQRPGSFFSTSQPQGFNPFANQNRCFLEKSTGLSVVAQSQGVIPTSGFFSRGVTAMCSSWCQLQGPYNCPAFTVDYNNNRCSLLSRPADVALRPGITNGQSYLEQVCFNDYYRGCEGKSWAFERVINQELRGFDDKVLYSINTRRDCEEACLRESRFLCLSAEYDKSRNECRLSRESKITRPFNLQPSDNVEYMENQCVPPNTLSSCVPQRQTGLTLLYAEAVLLNVFSEEECRRACLTFSNFTCNTAAYRQLAQECLLGTDATAVTLPDSVLIYSSCVQLNQVSPQNTNNFGFGNQIPNMFPGNSINSQFPSSNFYPVNRIPNTGISINSNSFLPINSFMTPNSNNFLPQNPGLFNQQSFPLSGQQFPPGNQQFFGQLPFSATGQLLPTTAQQFPISGNQFPTVGQQFPISGQQFPISGQQFPNSGQQFPTSGQQFPISGQQFPTSGQQFPTSGQQFPFSGQQIPNLQQAGHPFASNPNTFGGFSGPSSPFPINSAFGSQFPVVTQQPQRLPLNRDFLFQQQSVPFIIPGRSSISNKTSTDAIGVSAERKNPSQRFPFSTDSQPK